MAIGCLHCGGSGTSGVKALCTALSMGSERNKGQGKGKGEEQDAGAQQSTTVWRARVHGLIQDYDFLPETQIQPCRAGWTSSA